VPAPAAAVRSTESLRNIRAHSERAAIEGRVMQVRNKVEAQLREPTQLCESLPQPLNLRVAILLRASRQLSD
jgi:hypothetical protein